MIHNFKKMLLALTITSVAGPSMLSVVGCSSNTTEQTRELPAYSNKNAQFADQQDFPTGTKIQYSGRDQLHYNNTILSNVLKNPRYSNAIKQKLPYKKLNDIDNQFIQNLEPKFQYPARSSSKKQFQDFQSASEKIVQKDFPTLDKLVPFLVKENPYLKASNFKFQELISQYQSELQPTATKDLLQLYGSLVQLMGPKLVSQLFASIDFQATPPSPGVVASNIFNPGLNKQTIVFYGNLFADQSIINRQYIAGWWSVNSLMEVLAHEISHAISNLLWIAPTSRQYFDAAGLDNPQPLLIYSVSPNDYIPQFLGTRMDPIITNPQERAILTYALTWSNYGRTGAYDGFLNDSGLFNEIFAESFTEWLYTPVDLQAANWDFLNAFYDNYATSAVQPVKNNLFDFYQA